MKFTPEVVAALAVLRNAAENDFERHRLDVLERDLTAPPVVEVIDDTHQRFNGVTYLKCKDGHYSKGAFIHRVVFAYYYGEIPEGYHVHHLDDNKTNNAIVNLQCLTKQEHRRLHNKQPLQKQCVCKTCGKIFIVQKECQKHTMYCSKKCASRIKRICSLCGKDFLTSSHKPVEHCRSCARKLSWEKRRVQNPIRPSCQKRCPICGKSFVVKIGHEKTQCCSRSCGHKLQWQTRKLQKI
ncbi:MAG: HNH endonuclease [Selenomonadaceae bacterium]|nr:HNH endonuclease [Selenomonadaceae bacterium]